jgi:hypothetical protein
MNAVGVAILLIVVWVVFAASRRWALIGMLAGVLYLTQGQQLQVLGVNLFAIRFVELAGFIRVMVRREFSFSGLNRIDRGLLLLYGYTTLVFLLRSSEGVLNHIGTAVDAFLCYFTFRGLVGDISDLRWFLCAFLILLGPYVVLLLVERLARNNLFSAMGGIEYGTWERGGRLRCQGSFRHASLLGTLGASFLPLYIAMAASRLHRRLAIVGVGLCLAIVWASNSGGPASCVAVGILGWLMWRFRTQMRLFRWGLVAMIAALALVMKAPVWYLLARASSVTGGGGYHRAYLIGAAFKNLDQWGLAGMPLQDTSSWFPYTLSATGGSDITNQFLAFGIAAGLGATALFIAVLVRAFKHLGKAMWMIRSSDADFHDSEPLLWGLGVMLVVHITNWLGIAYFDQIYVIGFMQLAVIATVSEYVLNTAEIETASNTEPLLLMESVQ